MKAHRKLPPQMQQEVDRQKLELQEKIFREAAEEVTVQAISTFLWTMSTRFGWKGKRLSDLVEALHDTRDMMQSPTAMNHRFDPLDCEKQLLKDYGIDVRAEFKAEVEVRP